MNQKPLNIGDQSKQTLNQSSSKVLQGATATGRKQKSNEALLQHNSSLQNYVNVQGQENISSDTGANNKNEDIEEEENDCTLNKDNHHHLSDEQIQDKFNSAVSILNKDMSNFNEQKKNKKDDRSKKQ